MTISDEFTLSFGPAYSGLQWLDHEETITTAQMLKQNCSKVGLNAYPTNLELG